MIHNEHIETMRDNYDDHGAELAAKDAEIKRLRKEGDEQEDCIEQLRYIISQVADNIAGAPETIVEHSAEVGKALLRLDRQVAEIERLRTVDRHWAKLYDEQNSLVAALMDTVLKLRNENGVIKEQNAELQEAYDKYNIAIRESLRRASEFQWKVEVPDGT